MILNGVLWFEDIQLYEKLERRRIRKIYQG